MKIFHVFSLLALVAIFAGCAGTVRDEATVYSELDRLAAEPSDRETAWYIMEAGDTLYGIARRHNTTVADIQLLNPELGDPRKLSIGTRVRVPVSKEGNSRPINEPASSRPSPAPSRSGDFIWPVRGEVLTAFGDRVSDPAPRQNRGIDIAARQGENVRATGDGVAYVLPGDRHYGDVILVDHGDGMTSFYGYLKNIRISSNDRVRQGDTLARAGDRGRIHFRIMREDTPVDPQDMLP